MGVEADFNYVGDELEIFALAKHWKNYFAAAIAPFVKREVAEVGAGLGATTLVLCDPTVQAGWLCIEPDEAMATLLRQLRVSGRLPDRCAVHCGVIADLPIRQQFDTVLYIDVLEHIEDDQRELTDAASRLAMGGRIVVLSPAWPHLYSPFDRRIGHHRRYTKRSLTALRVNDLKVEQTFYLDSVGYLASLANRIMLKQSLPTRSQIAIWDRFMISASRVLDPLLMWSLGRSVVTVWSKHGSP